MIPFFSQWIEVTALNTSTDQETWHEWNEVDQRWYGDGLVILKGKSILELWTPYSRRNIKKYAKGFRYAEPRLYRLSEDKKGHIHRLQRLKPSQVSKALRSSQARLPPATPTKFKEIEVCELYI